MMSMASEEPEVSSTVRDLADRSVGQAKTAIMSLLATAKSASETVQSKTNTGETVAGQAVARGFGFAEQNISAILDFAQKLVRAPDLKEAAQLQTDFVKEQTSIMEKQVEELKSLDPGAKPAE